MRNQDQEDLEVEVNRGESLDRGWKRVNLEIEKRKGVEIWMGVKAERLIS